MSSGRWGGEGGFFSSLVVHHLNDEGKKALYQDLYDALTPSGALLLIDIVMPATDVAQIAVGDAWDAAVRKQPLAMTGPRRSTRSLKRMGGTVIHTPIRWICQPRSSGNFVGCRKSGLSG